MSTASPDLLRAGLTHQQGGRLAEAESCFRQALASSPDDASLLNNLGLVLYEKGDLAAAEQLLSRALQVQPGLVTAQHNLGKVLRDLDRMGEAEEWFERVLSAQPDDAETYIALAVCLERQGRFDDAEEYFHDAAGLSASYALARQIHFGADFFRELETAAAAPLAPPPEIVLTSSSSGDGGFNHVVLAACDATYFHQYGAAFINSCAANCRADSTLLHLHIADPDAAALDAARGLLERSGLPFTLSRENLATPPRPLAGPSAGPLAANAAKVYYACGRFIHLPAWLARYGKPMVVLDVDAVMEGNPSALVEAAIGVDMALNRRTPLRAPWLDIKAGFAVLRPTPAAARYARLVSEYLLWHVKEGELHWQLDQIALYCTLAMLRRFAAAASVPARGAAVAPPAVPPAAPPAVPPMVAWLADAQSPVWQLSRHVGGKTGDPRFLRFAVP